VSQPWYKDALIGVCARPSLALEGSLGQLVDEVTADEPEPALAYSRAMAVVAATRRAAVTLSEALVPLPAPCGDDDSALASTHPWVQPLGYCFTQAPQRLQYEACAQLRRHGYHLPPSLLPSALDAGRKSAELRQSLLPVLGVRGRWLAAINPHWSYASGTSTDGGDFDNKHQPWEFGTFAERLGYLRQLRSRSPAQARDLLHACLDELPAKERLAFVEIFAIGLAPEDEALLNQLLNDRSREVRRAASVLLARIPGSVQAKQLDAWLGALITPKRGLLGASWRCDAPAQADAKWSKAGINPKRPQNESLGERAWWLYQLVGCVPLNWWQTHTGMSPEQLLAWARKSDWKDALLRGWSGCVVAGEDAWIAAMIESKQALFARDRARLLALLEPAKRERYWPKTLSELQAGNLLPDVIESCTRGGVLSEAFSRGLIAGFAKALGGEGFRQNYLLRQQLAELVCVLHPESLKNWRPPPRTGDETSAQADALSTIERIVETRQALYSNPS
jgi:hypothetical protein